MKISSEELMAQYKANKLVCEFCGKPVPFVDGEWYSVHINGDGDVEVFHTECYQDYLLERTETKCNYNTEHINP